MTSPGVGTAANDSYQDTNTNEFQKNIGFGYQAAVGVQFRISDGLRGFAEIVASNIQLKSDGYTIKESISLDEVGGVEKPPADNELTESQRQKTGLNLTLPISSVGVSAGLALRF